MHHILAFFWIGGLIFGNTFLFLADDFPFSQMRSVLLQPASIISLLYTAVLPFLLSIFVVIIVNPLYLFPISFCKAAILSYFLLGAAELYEGAGCYFRVLFLSAEFLTAFLLYTLWLRILRRADRWKWEGCFLIALAILVEGIYFRIISPNLACLIDF